MELLKNELQDWWHEDFKERISNQSRKSQLDISNNTKVLKTLKKTFSMQNEIQTVSSDTFRTRGSIDCGKEQTERKMSPHKNQNLHHNENYLMGTSSHKTFSHNVIEPKLIRKQRLEPLNYEKLNIAHKENQKSERPSTVKMPKTNYTEKFRLRLSNNLDSMLPRTNNRYSKKYSK